MPDGYARLTLDTPYGAVAGRYYRARDARRAVIWVGGAAGDWDTPGADLYPILARALTGDGIASLRLRFRDPTRFDAAVADVLSGIDYLLSEGAVQIGLVGHCLGGAVVVEAASHAAAVRTIVALAAQRHGAGAIEKLTPRCSALLVHGTGDRVLPAACSEALYAKAGEPKRLVLFPGAGHGLDEVGPALQSLVGSWLREALVPAAPATSRG